MSRPGIMVCLPVDDKTPQIPGSLPVKCSDCPAMLSVSPSTWTILHDHPRLKIVCPICALFYSTEAPQSPTPAQIAEIKQLDKEMHG